MHDNEYMIRVGCIFTRLVQVALLGVEFNCNPLKCVRPTVFGIELPPPSSQRALKPDAPY